MKAVASVTPTPEPEESALVEAARAGDEAAFARLFRCHCDRVRTHLTRLVGPVPERDDVVQQIFLALHRALPSYRGDAALATLLYRMTINAAYDHLRARRRRRELALSERDVDLLLDRTVDGRDRASARADLLRMFRLLEEFDARKRIAFVLVAVEGRSLAEAAALVGASPGAVKQRVLTARRELTAILARDARREEGS